jgi:hypothetical protein
MDLTCTDDKVDATQDLDGILTCGRDVKILDAEEGGHACSLEPRGDSHYRRRRNY